MRRLISGLVFGICLCGTAISAEDDALSIPKPEGNLRYSVTVSRFDNRSGWTGQWDLGDAFTTIMTDALHSSGWFITLGDTGMRREALAEQDFAASGRTASGKKAPKTGRMTPAQLLVRGDITHVQHSTTGGKGGVSFKGIRVGGKTDASEVNITIYLVDSETGQVKASQKIVGKSGRKGLSLGYHGGGLGGLTGDMAGFKNDNLGKATENAVGQAVVYLIKQLEDIPWQASIVLVKKDGQVVLNRGTREGVQVGSMFKVGTVEDLVDPDTGEVLDTEITSVGALEVTSVKEKVAYCKALSGADKIEKGMTVIPGK